MKLLTAAIAVLIFGLLLPAAALGAENGTDANLTPVSVSQNATISVPTASMVGLTMIGTFENATVYVSGGANATITGDRLTVDIGPAARMEYRDVYLLYRLPAGFRSFSFDYDIVAGDKSNVLLVDFYDGTPRTGVLKGGIPDVSCIGMGTWTSRGYDIGGISGLKPFAQGAHRVDIFPSGDMLYLRLDGNANVTAFNYYTQKKYLLLHLMVGDENSYLRGTLSGLQYEGPPLDISLNATAGDHSGGIPGMPNTSLNGSGNVSGGIAGPGGDQTAGDPEHGAAKPLIGLNIWLALAAGAGFFAAWAIVYYKYINK
ncbi:MAG: hypothetical protein A4E28_01746 [Methanocella sp. PtaU1.Bin125]|nr:MAG: hypothetical protein A4E28_01746 [Methanocella sp. PtaU1.Bin125]